MTCVVVRFQKRRKKNQSTLTATKFCWRLTAPEDKMQKENETPRVIRELESSGFLTKADDGECMNFTTSSSSALFL